jgi:hypothetical protein
MNASTERELSATAPDPFVRLAAELAAEVWVTKRRLHTVERELARRGIELDIDRAAASDAGDRTERDAFIARIFGTVLPADS